MSAAHGQAGWNGGDKIDHPDFEETSLEDLRKKILAGWDGQNRHASTHKIVIGLDGSSYLTLYPDGTYCYYETAT